MAFSRVISLRYNIKELTIFFSVYKYNVLDHVLHKLRLIDITSIAKGSMLHIIFKLFSSQNG